MEELPARVKEGRSANSANSPTGSIVSRGYFHVACACTILKKKKGREMKLMSANEQVQVITISRGCVIERAPRPVCLKEKTTFKLP